MKKAILLLSFALLLTPVANSAETTVRIKAGSNYDGYSNNELRRRVWDLERAVEKLQDQMFQLAMQNGSHNNGSTYAGPTKNPWTCKIESFGKTFVSTETTKASALAKVMKKCSDSSSAIHCDEEDVKCGNE